MNTRVVTGSGLTPTLTGPDPEPEPDFPTLTPTRPRPQSNFYHVVGSLVIICSSQVNSFIASLLVCFEFT